MKLRITGVAAVLIVISCVQYAFAVEFASMNINLNGFQEMGTCTAVDVPPGSDKAYCCIGKSLVVLDVDNKAQPTKLGVLPLTTLGKRIFYYSKTGDTELVFIAAGSAGLRVIDVTDPSNLVETAQFVEIDNHILGVYVSDAYTYDRVYLAATSGLIILDFTNPSTYSERGRLDINQGTRSIVVDSFRAYMADNEGLKIVDVSNPSNPSVLGTYSVPLYSFSYDVDVSPSGDRAFVACSNVLIKVDVSDPSDPSMVWEYPQGGFSVKSVADVVYLGASGGLYCIYASGTVPVHWGLIEGFVRDVSVPGVQGGEWPYTWAYIAGERNGFRIANVGQLSGCEYTQCPDPGITGDYTSRGTPVCLDVNTFPDGGSTIDLAYVGVKNGVKGLIVIDVSNPTQITLAGNSNFNDPVWDVLIHNPANMITYVGDIWKVIHMGTYPDPRAPYSWTDYPVFAAVRSLAMNQSDDLLFVGYAYSSTKRQAGLEIVRHVSGIYTSLADVEMWTPQDLVSVGTYLFVADGEEGVKILDVEDPENPITIAHYETGSSANGITVDGDVAYVANEDMLLVLDVSDPENPVEITRVILNGKAWKVEVSDDYLYVADQIRGLRVFDISTPDYIYEVGYYEVPSVNDVVVYNDAVYITAEDYGMFSLEFTPPSGVTTCGGTCTVYDGSTMTISNGEMFIVSSQGTLNLEPGGEIVVEAGGILTVQGHFDQSGVLTLQPGGMIGFTETSTVYLASDLNIPMGASVFIVGGSVVTIASEDAVGIGNPDLVEINCEGLLSLAGSTLGTVTMRCEIPGADNWAGIKWISGGTNGSGIAFVDISDAVVGIDVDGSAPIILGNLTLSNCTVGLRITGRHDLTVSNPISGGISGCTKGIELVGASIDITHMTIHDNGTGIRCDQSSPTVRNCTIYSNDVGVLTVDATSIPDLGTLTDPGNNDFYGPGTGYPGLANDLHITAMNPESDIYAQKNWWGTVKPQNIAARIIVIYAPPQGEGSVIYDNWLEQAPGGGGQGVSRQNDPDVNPAGPKKSFLNQNYPNPFNPVTTISFGVSGHSRVKLSIYDTLGRRVRELANETLGAGLYQRSWDGTDANGNAVASGVYFYRLESAEFTETKKMLLLR